MGLQAFWKVISQPQFVGDEGGMEAQLAYPSSHLSALDGWMDGGKISFFSVSNGSSPAKHFALMYFVVNHLPPFENFPHQPCFYII